MSKKTNWSVKTVNSKKGSYAIVKGRAYPEVVKGKNATKTVKANHTDRKAFYNDPAVKLSDADLDEIDGAEGAPLCFEHDRKDVVGNVHHSWIEDGGRCLQIVGRIPLNERGRKLVDEIQCGKVKGFSVGYGTEMDCPDGNWETKNLTSKTFHEISLVYEPFFEDCNLTVGVLASSKTSPTAEDQHRIYVPIEMSATPSDAPAPTAPTTTSTQAAPAPAAAAAPAQQSSIMPPAGQNKEAEDLLRQTDLLKEQLKDAEKLKAENAYWRKKADEEAEKYKKEREPQAKEYIEAQEKMLGKQLDEAIKKQYMNAFTRPEFKDNADLLWSQHKHTVELTASAKSVADELNAVKAERVKLSETLAKVGQQVGGMRASYAQSLSHELTPAQSEAAMAMDDANRKAVGVTASRGALALNEIMVAAPSASELPFLVKGGYSRTVNGDVNASASDYDQHRTIRTSVQAAREHRLLRDENGELQFAASMRYHFPAGMGWFCNESGLDRADSHEFENFVQIKESFQRKAADEKI